ncbi:uncharacterized protein LOC111685593 [Lucilia cuprina]|uniref:uncharacterized protein LOC111685593 n=1 Tax=Lucilia cuprina TaxID=7375 RepID=UPI001F0598C5|nr:uncharacterized protein LOC111685593 [Lucilia cuprina]
MSNKQTSTSTTIFQPQQQTPRAQDQRITLIRNVRKHPRLYKSEFLHTPFLHRHEKQQIWDRIAQDSGFEKTEDAKCKWRSLINYLRQHLDSVTQKKLRRYIPVTENPEDKYVQLTDWSFYNELEFVVPYVKFAASKQNNSGAGNQIEISANEIDLILEGIEAEVDKRNEEQRQQLTENDFAIQVQQELAKEEEQIEQPPSNGDNKLMLLTNNDNDLTGDDDDDDVILKEYFENMLKSTLKLPRFHQNRIREKLLNCVNEQKDMNKIN